MDLGPNLETLFNFEIYLKFKRLNFNGDDFQFLNEISFYFRPKDSTWNPPQLYCVGLNLGHIYEGYFKFCIGDILNIMCLQLPSPTWDCFGQMSINT
jgi:hypothetical protein